MYTSGFLKFSRGWKRDHRSPLYGLKHRKYYEVWRELCERADFADIHGMVKGEVSIKVRDLATDLGLTRTTCSDAIGYLKSLGMIVVLSKEPCLRIAISRYDDLECLERYFGWPPKNDLTQNQDSAHDEKSRTEQSSITALKLLPKIGCQKTIPDSVKKSRTDPGPSEEYATMRDDDEKSCAKNSLRTDPGQNDPILKNKEYIDINNYSAKSDGAVPPSIAYRRKAGGDVVSDFDHEIAKTWANRMKAHDKAQAQTSGKPVRERKPPLEKWADTIRKLRTIDGLSEDDIRLIVETRFSDDFYSTTGMCPSNLRSKSQNGHPKWLNLLTKGQRTLKEENATTSSKTPLKPMHKILTLEELLK